MSGEYATKLQATYGFNPPPENIYAEDEFLKKLMKTYANTKQCVDPFGRRKSTPLEIKKVLDKIAS